MHKLKFDGFQARQGDVFVIEVDDIPSKTTEVAREDENIVLAHGEVTGHRHRIPSRHATLVRTEMDSRFMRVTAPVKLFHEEHSAIAIPAGKYVATIQREYHPEAIRAVED
jgi:hypothetical protein